jgi:hypothetical protein
MNLNRSNRRAGRVNAPVVCDRLTGAFTRPARPLLTLPQLFFHCFRTHQRLLAGEILTYISRH